MKKMPSLKIGVPTVRGIVGESFTPQLAAEFAAAFGSYCGPSEVVVGTDTRTSRVMITHAVVSGLLSVGCTPIEAGVVPSPALQHSIRTGNAAGGICITASHNPIQWNALKFFNSEGVALSPNQFAELTGLYHQGAYARVPSKDIRRLKTDDSVISKHLGMIVESLAAGMIRKKKFKVAVDCCNGAASTAAPDFLGMLGCEVYEFNCGLDKPFPRNPEPVRQNIEEFCNFVRDSEAEIGFALDADADRLAIVDGRGVSLGEDYTLALVASYYLESDPSPIVVNVSTSQVMEDIARRFNVVVHRTRVGETHVVEKLLRTGAGIGGEGNGGVIIPRLNPCRDAFVGMGYILQYMADKGKGIRELKALLPAYEMIKSVVTCRPRDIVHFKSMLKNLYQDHRLVEIDGLKVFRGSGWIHVRGSMTEPVLRIIVEAESRREAEVMLSEVLDYLRPLVRRTFGD